MCTRALFELTLDIHLTDHIASDPVKYALSDF